MKQPTLLTIRSVPVSDIRGTLQRLRPVSEAGVESLLASIEETGVMKDAIHVRKKKDGELVLIAGAHRLEAARRLGWDEIEAKVWTNVTDDWARLMEIDDNLAGAEMNALDTAVFLAQRKEIYERLHPETKAATGAALVAKRWNPDTSDIVSFVSATSEKFGVSKRHVERMIAAGVKLAPNEVAQLRSAPKPVTLKDLTEIGRIGVVTERYDVVDRLASGRAKSAADARRAIRLEQEGKATVQDPVDQQYMALMRAWARAGAKARKRFLFECEQDIWQAQNAGAPLNKWDEASDSQEVAAE
ncbi:MAG: ParB N-terminal domain-containing protein [Pseudomonas balearica]|nr:ParB N-terminal domain-containing protein [Stutzerimonas balearica]